MNKVWSAQTGLILLAVAAVGVTVWSYRSLGRYRPFADLMNPRPNPMGQLELQIWDAAVTGRTDGKVRWRVKARSISVGRDRSNVTADDIHDGLFYDGAGRPVARVSARRGSYQGPGGVLGAAPLSFLQLTDGIEARVLLPGGPTVHADRLIWDSFHNLVEAPGEVTAVFPNGAGSTSGSDIKLNTRTHDISLTHLHGTFRIGRLVN